MSIPKLKNLIEASIDKPSRIGGVVVKSDGKLLLTKRSELAGKYPNFWAVPMGHVEDDEKFIDGAARELKEETMLDIDSDSLVYLDIMTHNHYQDRWKEN